MFFLPVAARVGYIRLVHQLKGDRLNDIHHVLLQPAFLPSSHCTDMTGGVGFEGAVCRMTTPTYQFVPFQTQAICNLRDRGRDMRFSPFPGSCLGASTWPTGIVSPASTPRTSKMLEERHPGLQPKIMHWTAVLSLLGSNHKKSQNHDSDANSLAYWKAATSVVSVWAR